MRWVDERAARVGPTANSSVTRTILESAPHVRAPPPIRAVPHMRCSREYWLEHSGRSPLMSQASLSSQLDAERAAILDRAAASVFAVESARVRQSAFLWRGGLLVTAAEPLEGAESLRVLKDGSSSEGEVLACDLRTDIAVVRCAAAVAPALPPTTTAPRIGQTIAVLGR